MYNERGTFLPLFERVHAIPIDKEILIIDDGSADATWDLLQEVARRPGVRVFRQQPNQGKGAAVRRGFQEATGDYVVVQDADLEYEPEQLGKLLAPVEAGAADVAYGSRFLEGAPTIRRRFRFYNWVLTTWSNVLNGQRLTDVWTCYKMLPRRLVQSLALEENRFGFEAEVTAKLKKLGQRIIEVPIAYHPRTRAQGKKIRARDGLRGLYVTAKYRFKRLPRNPKAP